jgi:hypothetical protein
VQGALGAAPSRRFQARGSLRSARRSDRPLVASNDPWRRILASAGKLLEEAGIDTNSFFRSEEIRSG